MTDDTIRDRLLEERSEAETRAAALEKEISSIVASMSFGATDDEHDPEGATIAFEREQAMVLLADARAEIESLDRALVRMADGTYGRCEVCGGTIAPERLAARPAATRCIACASRRR